jgi:holo-[acyl-carrier-protein] synthase
MERETVCITCYSNWTIMIGIDIVEVRRIGNIYQKHGSLFLEKLLDEQEISELPAERNRYFLRRLSCYIASKEAIYKAYDNADLGWKDIAIRNITETPIIYIKESDMTGKIKLALAISRDIVISQAVII